MLQQALAHTRADCGRHAILARIKLFINDIYHLKVLNLVSLSTQSLASCVNYFCLELFTVFFQHENRFRYKFFRYCSIFKVLCALALRLTT